MAGRKTTHPRRCAQTEGPVIYRGIRIMPMPGRRSPLAEALREGFRRNAALARAEAAED